MSMRTAPPGRASASQRGLVKPFGPHHTASIFGSVQALNTSARGAFTTRVSVSSRIASCLSMIVGLLEFRDVELDHPHDRLEHSVGFGAILVHQHSGKNVGNDLPR